MGSTIDKDYAFKQLKDRCIEEGLVPPQPLPFGDDVYTGINDDGTLMFGKPSTRHISMLIFQTLAGFCDHETMMWKQRTSSTRRRETGETRTECLNYMTPSRSQTMNPHGEWFVTSSSSCSSTNVILVHPLDGSQRSHWQSDLPARDITFNVQSNGQLSSFVCSLKNLEGLELDRA
jgi:hypothetical protein